MRMPEAHRRPVPTPEPAGQHDGSSASQSHEASISTAISVHEASAAEVQPGTGADL
jgi:hypothetical protein